MKMIIPYQFLDHKSESALILFWKILLKQNLSALDFYIITPVDALTSLIMLSNGVNQIITAPQAAFMHTLLDTNIRVRKSRVTPALSMPYFCNREYWYRGGCA